jgi:hypothetical protein
MVKYFGIRKYKDTYQREREEFEEKYFDILHNPEAQTFLEDEWEMKKLEISDRLIFAKKKVECLTKESSYYEIDYDCIDDIFWMYYGMVQSEHENNVSSLDILKHTLLLTRQYVYENYSLMRKLRKPLPEAEKYTQAFLEKFEAHRIDKKGD